MTESHVYYTLPWTKYSYGTNNLTQLYFEIEKKKPDSPKNAQKRQIKKGCRVGLIQSVHVLESLSYNPCPQHRLELKSTFKTKNGN
jgi:hypothetical protein